MAEDYEGLDWSCFFLVRPRQNKRPMIGWSDKGRAFSPSLVKQRSDQASSGLTGLSPLTVTPIHFNVNEFLALSHVGRDASTEFR
jgi:hypothetical protein